MQVSKDQWLEERFNCPVFCLKPGPGKMPALPPRCFAYAKTAVEDIESARRLTGHGFFLADTNILFESDSLAAGPGSAGLDVTPALPEDREAVMAIAGSAFLHTRFHADPEVPKHLADRIKADWAGNYFDGGRGDLMLLAKKDGKVIGFNQVLIRDGTAVIDLIAVDRDFQRQGAGRAMIGALAGKYKSVRVGTQLGNRESAALYESMGFKLVSAQYVFHYHGRAAA